MKWLLLSACANFVHESHTCFAETFMERQFLMTFGLDYDSFNLAHTSFSTRYHSKILFSVLSPRNILQLFLKTTVDIIDLIFRSRKYSSPTVKDY